MSDSRPHTCSFCPIEVRSLYAAAQNASRAFERALGSAPDAADLLHAVRMMRELRDELARVHPLVNGHFAAVAAGDAARAAC